jgi:Lon protease-like protein
MTLRLPLFPLGVVLFPGALLPLHIFEPRYRRMLSDCLARGTPFGLALPGVSHEAPSPGAIGCTAEIRGAHALPDGRSNIIVQGGSRFLITRYVDDPAPYLVAMVEQFADRDDTAPTTAQCEALALGFARYAPALRELNDLESDQRALPTAATDLSFHVAAALDCGPGEKQQLLEIRSTVERIDRLLELLPPLTSEIEAGLRTRRRAPTNGRGHHHPDLQGEGER